MPLRFAACLALACSLAAPAAIAAQLSFAHYAPGAGPVTVRIAERDLALDYKGFVPVADFDAGVYSLLAEDAAGNALAEGHLALRADDRYVVILAGNGSTHAPFQWRLAIDHNHPFLPGQSSLQSASLAIFGPVDFSPPPAPQTTAACSNGSTVATTYEVFGSGTYTLEGDGSAGDFTMEANRPTCTHSSAADGGPSELVISAQPGDRLRRFLIGDGEHEPHELVLVRQGREPIKPVMAPDGSLEGLWAVAGQSNTGLQVAFDREAAAPNRLSAVFFGFDPDGNATWRTLEGKRVLEYVGGNVDGTRGAVGFERAANAALIAHTCREMTLIVPSESPSSVFPLAPRNAMTLRRLFPTACPPAVRQPEATP